MAEPHPSPPARLPDWEAFYRDYRKPGYVPGFEITSKLGGGAFGLVFRARKESIGKDYAIKFLKVEDSEIRQAVLRELEQVNYFAQVDHPNLVQIEDRGEVDGIPYLVMQFAGSETLRDRIPADGVPPAGPAKEELLRWFLQACRGVAALHERSLVHFDLKPANVFLKGPVARVGDYGLSKLVTHSRGSLTMGRGTPYYMAPELLQRRGDHRSDVYSLGVMLYELLCGRLPFLGDSEWEVLQKHEREAPQFPAHLSATERAVLQRCLQKDPMARYQSASELVAALAGLAGVPAGAAAPAAAVAPAAVAPAAWADAADVPPCVPPLPPGVPPLPPVSPPRRPAVRQMSPARRALPLVLAAIAVAFVVSSRLPHRDRGRGGYVRVSRSGDQVEVMRHADSLRARLDALVDRARSAALAAAARLQRIRLTELPVERLGAPPDLRDYTGMVQLLADAHDYSEGHATKLARYGRPLFLAAVATLQGYDYTREDDCRRAAHTTALLAHMTGLTGLRLDPPVCEPGLADTCRFQVHADAWRRVAEEFAATDPDFEALVDTHRGGR